MKQQARDVHKERAFVVVLLLLGTLLALGSLYLQGRHRNIPRQSAGTAYRETPGPRP
ncbi:MAG TPA: hypothetical protein VFN53_04915 [Acidobacteriaceae bacterium]|nr:hypothetical protein [Acidobacteriaceae bacterium]